MDFLEKISVNTTCVPKESADWLDWKSFLRILFTIPADFKLSQYYIFIFYSFFKGLVEVKSLFSDNTSQRFSLVKKYGKILSEGFDWMGMLSHEKFSAMWERDLGAAKSAKQDNRKIYLRIVILDRYYKYIDAVRTA